MRYDTIEEFNNNNKIISHPLLVNYPSLDYVTSVYIASHDVITVFCVSRVKTAVFRDIHSVDSRQHHSSRGQRRQDEREMYIHRVPIKNM